MPKTEIWIMWLIPIVFITFGLSGLILWNVHQNHVQNFEHSLKEQHQEELESLKAEHKAEISTLKKKLVVQRKVSVFDKTPNEMQGE